MVAQQQESELQNSIGPVLGRLLMKVVRRRWRRGDTARSKADELLSARDRSRYFLRKLGLLATVPSKLSTVLAFLTVPALLLVAQGVRHIVVWLFGCRWIPPAASTGLSTSLGLLSLIVAIAILVAERLKGARILSPSATLLRQSGAYPLLVLSVVYSLAMYLLPNDSWFALLATIALSLLTIRCVAKIVTLLIDEPALATAHEDVVRFEVRRLGRELTEERLARNLVREALSGLDNIKMGNLYGALRSSGDPVITARRSGFVSDMYLPSLEALSKEVRRVAQYQESAGGTSTSENQPVSLRQYLRKGAFSAIIPLEIGDPIARGAPILILKGIDAAGLGYAETIQRLARETILIDSERAASREYERFVRDLGQQLVDRMGHA